MNKAHKKLGFFQKIILAITDFRFYPVMLKTEKTSKSVAHFILFLLLLTFIMAGSFLEVAFDGIDAMLSKYDEKVPEFYLEDGILSVETKEVYRVLNDLVIIVNTDNLYEEMDEIEEYEEYYVYNNRLFINSDAMTYESELGYDGVTEQETLQITQLPLSEITMNYNKASLQQYIEDVRAATTTKMFVFMTLFIATFLTYAFTKIFEVFLYAVMTSLVAAISGMKLNFKNYFKIALYVVTLPYILETISVIYLGAVSDNSFIISNLVAYIYILYAVRAVKLDAFILIMNSPNKMKKSKDGKTIVSIEKDENESDDTIKQEEKKTDDEDNTQN